MRMRMRTTITIRATCEWPSGRWEVRASGLAYRPFSLLFRVVLPDSTPAASTAAPSATALSTPGLRDSAFSSESGICFYYLIFLGIGWSAAVPL